MSRFAISTDRNGLYSPPQVNRRLRKREPRPQKAKSMTIAAGFRCADGVVLCTDSEYWAGQTKYYGPKIFEANPSNGMVYIAGAGDSEFIGSVAQEVRQEFENKEASLDQVKVSIESKVREKYTEHYTLAQQASDPNAPIPVTLLVATRFDYEAKLFKVRETGNISEVGPGMAFTGTQAGESVFRAMASIFFRTNFSRVSEMRAVAFHLVRVASEFSTYAGGYPQTVCIEDYGSKLVEIEPSSSVGIDPFTYLLWRVPVILRDIAEGEEGDLEERLIELNEDIRKVLKTRKESQENRHPWDKEKEWLW